MIQKTNDKFQYLNGKMSNWSSMQESWINYWISYV